ncbi:MAG: hypothetical protein GY794_21710, partial [bacterium]|nr:hypothetical protein [bacterium]
DENEEVDIRIVTQDEHLARLPWVLLADKGIFLSTIGWSVVLSGNTETRACELPSSPEMLIVAPQAEDYGDTQADTHLERLEERLSAGDRRLSFGQRLQRVASWEEFVHAAQNSTPQIVYYYGHGGGDSDSSKLVFTNGKTRQGHLIPAADFAVYLRRMEIPPTLVYVNCCQGDTGGLLGIGRQLEDFVPAVLTNRTLASVEAAQAQAIAFWENVLLKGVAPHKAVTALYGNLGELNITTADTRWMTPVFYGHYESWTANPPRPLHRLEHDPHWHLKIDRVSQFGTVSLLTRQMLRERKPRSLAFVWYGQAGQGIEIFHQRLNVELREDLSDAFVYEVRPAWPLELANYHHSFKSMMLEVFEVDSLEEIPAHIRSKTRGTFGKQTLLYVRHQPVTSTKVINPKTLKSYLEWWNALFIPLLRGTQTHALLGVSFIVKNPPKFRSLILDKERIEDLYLEDTVFRLLDQMEEVALR